MPIATTMKPTISGGRLARGGWLRSSFSAKMNASRNAVPTTWSTNGPTQLPRYLAGNLAKIEYVGTEFGSPRDPHAKRRGLPKAARAAERAAPFPALERTAGGVGGRHARPAPAAARDPRPSRRARADDRRRRRASAAP